MPVHQHPAIGGDVNQQDGKTLIMRGVAYRCADLVRLEPAAPVAQEVARDVVVGVVAGNAKRFRHFNKIT